MGRLPLLGALTGAFGVACGACSSTPAGSQDSGAGDAPAPSASDARAEASPSVDGSGAEAGNGGLSWQVVGVLDAFPDDTSDLVVVGGYIYSPQSERKWSLVSAAESPAPFTTSVSVSDRQHGCSCLVGSQSFVLGGGGDGVTAAWLEPTYLVADFDLHTLDSHASPYPLHDTACALGNDVCYVLGGSTSETGPWGSPGVRVFDPADGGFGVAAELPVPTASAGAAAGGGKLLVAGGYCSGGGQCPPNNDPGGPVAVLTNAYAADVANPVWQAQPSLPRPVTGAGMVYLSARFYLVGGSRSVYGPSGPTGALSYAMGDAAWRDEGSLPGAGPVTAVLTDGQAIYVSQYDGSTFEYSLYKGSL